MKTTKVKPFLKWNGGKGKLTKVIHSYMPNEFNDYYEPFLGGGALFWYLKSNNLIKAKAILSDLNPKLITTYQVVRDDVDKLIKELYYLEGEHCKEFYYEIRDYPKNHPDYKFSPLETAASFIYLNKTCFNGLYRENSKGFFNVPVGSYKNPTIYDKENLLKCSELLQGVILHTLHYLDISPLEKDFVYLDPPYIPLKDTSNFVNYTKDGFTHADQMSLRNWMFNQVHKGVYCLQSNSSSEIVYNLYKYDQFKLIEIEATRSSAAKKESRGKVKELLIQGNNYDSYIS